jgi:hypothetical protein
MADRDQNWSQRGRRNDPEWRRRDQDERRAGERPGERPGERRTFGEGGEPWRGEGRYGARYDQDRAGYGGQEYGVEGGRDHRRDPGERYLRDRDEDQREMWSPDRGEPYGDLELNPRNRGIQDYGPPHDYAYHPQAGHEFDPDYLHWREEQMRSHDRDYHEWRRNQRQAYDEDYRRFRTERREHFGRTFQDWRTQRSAVGGIADTTVAPGVSGYGAKVGMPSGYDAGAASRPSGMIEPPEDLNASAAAGQTGGEAQGGGSGPSGRRDASPEFGKEPPQVKAAAEGWDGRGAPEERLDRDRPSRDEQE